MGDATIVLGSQFGDEGKARIVDIFTKYHNIIARTSGGPNAGHTIINEKGTFKLHQLPAGIIYFDKINIIGNGTVVNPITLIEELKQINDPGLLYISERAHVITPYHIILDKLEEKRRAAGSIGTTCKGIGPAYTDKFARRGIRMIDLYSKDTLLKKIKQNLEYTNGVLKGVYNQAPLDPISVVEELEPVLTEVIPFIDNTSKRIQDNLNSKGRLLCEGTQGSFLDIDHGTYPYVSSSNPTAGGVCVGAGIGPVSVSKIIGVMKAYTTRVGNGPFPTEVQEKTENTWLKKAMKWEQQQVEPEGVDGSIFL